MSEKLHSSICTQTQLETADFRRWADRMKEPFRWHRKVWEYSYIAQALFERGMLEPGRRGLGFAVGREPLAALFASLGCEIVATDMEEEKARQSGWTRTGQHANNLQSLNERGICDPAEFQRFVSFRIVDMNGVPSDLTGFDFCWSACAFEHLGSIAKGKQFIANMLQCLKPGGVAVHTTEFNVSSNTDTRDHDEEYVFFRRRDIEDIARSLRSQGHRIDLDFSLGAGEKDQYVDPDPFTNPNFTVHLKLKIDPYIVTLMGLIIERGEPRMPARIWDRVRSMLPTRGRAVARN